MTSYQGGKSRIGERIYKILTLIEDDLNPDEMLPYFEPFVGMAGVLRHFGKNDPERDLFACDANKDLILLWKAVQRGWKPPLKCTKKKWESLKESKRHSAERGFIGIVGSFSSIFFSGYRLEAGGRDYLRQGYNGINKVLPNIQSVTFLDASSYDEFRPKGYLIYCDPPYVGHTLKGNDHFYDFDHDFFWETMRKWSKDNIVVVSECKAPRDFKKIWTFKSRITSRGVTKKYDDCLFIHESLYNELEPATKRDIKRII